jgi:2-iminobutanoate/2-iminopropanoate deaminase
MSRESIVSSKLAPVAGPFSPAIRSGDLIYLSGQVAQDATSGKLIAGDVRAQTEQIFSNLSAVLEAAGKNLSDVIRVGVYLTDMGDFAAMNEVYARHFTKPYPARTCIGVASLPLKAQVEIDVVAR